MTTAIISVLVYLIVIVIVIAALYYRGEQDVDDTDVVEMGYEAGKLPDDDLK